MENTISFEQLPDAIVRLLNKVEHLEQLIINQQVIKHETTDEILGVKETAEFLNLSVPTIYSKVSRRELPVMKQGKLLHFSKKELLEYLKMGKRRTNYELIQETLNR